MIANVRINGGTPNKLAISYLQILLLGWSLGTTDKPIQPTVADRRSSMVKSSKQTACAVTIPCAFFVVQREQLLRVLCCDMHWILYQACRDLLAGTGIMGCIAHGFRTLESGEHTRTHWPLAESRGFSCNVKLQKRPAFFADPVRQTLPRTSVDKWTSIDSSGGCAGCPYRYHKWCTPIIDG